MSYLMLPKLEAVLGSSEKIKESEYAFKCPNRSCKSHLKNKNKLIVNTQKGLYHCWVCHERGSNVYWLLRKYSIGSKSQIDEIAKFYKTNTKLNLSNIVDVSNQTPSLYIPEGSYFLLSRKNEHTLNSIRYLLSRGLAKDDIIRYNIHFCEEGDYESRLIIPSYDTNNNLNNFIARAVYPFYTPKYLEPKVKKSEIIHFENLINWNLPIILTEGYFDAITIKHNCIPLTGTFITKKLYNKILQTKPQVTICLDGMAKQESLVIAKKLHNKGISVRLTILPENEDPNSLGYKKVWEYINNSIEVNLPYLLKQQLT